MPYEPFLLGVGVVFNTLKQKSTHHHKQLEKVQETTRLGATRLRACEGEICL